MAAGISKTLWSMINLAELVEAAQPKPGPRNSIRESELAQATRHVFVGRQIVDGNAN